MKTKTFQIDADSLTAGVTLLRQRQEYNQVCVLVAVNISLIGTDDDRLWGVLRTSNNGRTTLALMDSIADPAKYKVIG